MLPHRRGRRRVPAPPSGGLEQLQVLHAQPVARLLRPRCIPVLGKQVPLVGDECSSLPGASSCLEAHCVHVHVSPGAQFQHLTAAADSGCGAQASAGEMDGLAQVARSRVRVKTGPEQIHDLLAVQAVRVGQRENFDQFGCPLVPPCACRDRLAVNPDREPAQQHDLVTGHTTNVTGERPGNASPLASSPEPANGPGDTMTLQLGDTAPDFEARNDPGPHRIPRLDRRLVGGAVLSSQGLHTRLHHRARLHGEDQAGVRPPRRQDHRAVRRPGGPARAMGR